MLPLATCLREGDIGIFMVDLGLEKRGSSVGIGHRQPNRHAFEEKSTGSGTTRGGGATGDGGARSSSKKINTSSIRNSTPTEPAGPVVAVSIF